MSVRTVKEKATGTIRNLGRAALHAISPDDFEYYACTFELINSSDNKILDIFHFPVMPNAISVGRQSLASIKKSGRGYSSQVSDSFVGRNISISGTFGRKFRLLISVDKNRDLKTGKGGQFDLKVKTGYGSLKLMENIIERSFSSNAQGIPNFLVLHNHSFNQSYVVEVLNFQVNQSMENNMMWNYSMEIKALADYTKIINNSDAKKRLVNLLATSVISSTGNEIFDEVKSALDITSKLNNIL